MLGQIGQCGEDKFEVHKGHFCYHSKRIRRSTWFVPASLRKMLRKYFHDTVLSGHLDAHKTFQKIATNFYGLKCRPRFSRTCTCVNCVNTGNPHSTRELVCTRLIRVLDRWRGCLSILFYRLLGLSGVILPSY